jgi:maltose/moltooligosaccharide transporter
MAKPRMTFWQIVNMNIGFFGIQFSFGLQQSSMSPIYKYLGADEASLPYLWLAGPVTGLLVQPLIGAMSDRTVSRWGRRTPYFLIGAILCSLGLLAMPYSPTLWMAASLLWILDSANNVTMEPYRAFVSDKLPASQHSLGFLTQSAFTGLGQTLAYLTPSLLVWIGMDKDAVNGSHIPQVVVAAFLIGAVCSLVSVLWSVKTTPEDPLSPQVLAALRATPGGWRHTLAEIAAAVRDMPPTMKQLALVKLFQWYAMFCYWQFITLSLARTLFGTSDAASPGFRDAGLLNGQIGAFYNFIAFLAAFALVPFARRHGPHVVHSVCLLLAGCIPPERTGVYMGIFNMFIVLPMIVQIFTLPLLYGPVLGGHPENVIRLAGVLMLCAAVAVLWVKLKPAGAAGSAPGLSAVR